MKDKEIKTPEEHERMSEKEQQEKNRRTFIKWLERLQASDPIMHINGEAQTHSPMTAEEAQLHLDLYDGKVKHTPEVALELAQYEVARFPKAKRSIVKMWKAMEAVKVQ